METRDVVIVGGGPAGLAAAVELYKKGIRNVLIVEREKTMGGILRQCIHDGFGLTRFGEALSGPEYAQKFIDEVMELKIPYVKTAEKWLAGYAFSGLSGTIPEGTLLVDCIQKTTIYSFES